MSAGYAGQIDGVPVLPLELWLWLGGIGIAVVTAHHALSWWRAPRKTSALMALNPSDYRFLKLLKFSPFERRARGGWRFGCKTISDPVVERMIASGRAPGDGETVWLVVCE